MFLLHTHAGAHEEVNVGRKSGRQCNINAYENVGRVTVVTVVKIDSIW